MSENQRVQQQAGFILHHFNYRETSRIYELFTADYGRISVVGRSVRGSKNRHTAELQAFVPLLMSWQGKSELKTLTGHERAQPSGSSAAPLRDTALYCGFYLNELLLRLLPKQEAYPELFQHYQQALIALATGEPELQVVLRVFERDLLDLLGYSLNLLEDQQGKTIDPHAWYDYEFELGAKLSSESNGNVTGQALLELAAGEFSSAVYEVMARKLLRQTLQQYLGEQPLKSRQLLLALRQV